MNRWKWAPPLLATLPLKLAEREIVETVTAWDPDVISATGIRWLGRLQALLRSHQILAPCPSKAGSGPHACAWRCYDPSAKVSIVLPTYNGIKYLCQSIESCLNQTHTNIELIIVDDGSPEDIKSIVNEYVDSRVTFVRHDRNRGLSEALNTGFARSTGEYLSWTSDDNFYDERAIETMLRFMQTYPKIDFVYADYYIIDERQPDQPCRVQRVRPADCLKVRNGIGACFLYKRKVYETVGEFNSRVCLAEDYEYWLRVWKQFRMQRLFRPLYYYRFHRDSLTCIHGPAEVSEKVKLVKELNEIT